MKQLTLTFILALFAITATAQHEPFISYSGTSSQTNVGATWDIGSETVDLNSFIGLSNDYLILGTGVDVVSGNLLGADLFLGADIQYAVANHQSIGILTPKAGFTFPIAGSRINLYTSFNQYELNNTQWVPLSVSLSF